MNAWFKIGAAVCFLGVALGAFGAHALRDTLVARNSRDVWNTAVLYQFLHGLALIVLSLAQVSRAVAYLFLLGVLLFSGSLYFLCVVSVHWLGAITPLGGLCFLAGWAWLIIKPHK